MSGNFMNTFESFVSHQDQDTKTKKKKTLSSVLSCICCLEVDTSYVNLRSCSHSDFLDNFKKPEIEPLQQVICHQCHEMLKKIKLFQLQVEESFKLLSEEDLCDTNDTEESNHRIIKVKRGLTCSNILKITITDKGCKFTTNEGTRIKLNKRNINKNITFKVTNINNEKYIEVGSSEARHKVTEINDNNKSQKDKGKSQNNDDIAFQRFIDSIILNTLNRGETNDSKINKDNTPLNKQQGSNYNHDSNIKIENLLSMNIENNEDSLIKTEDKPQIQKKNKIANIEKALSIINQNSNNNGVNLLVNSIHSIAGNVTGANSNNALGMASTKTTTYNIPSSANPILYSMLNKVNIPANTYLSDNTNLVETTIGNAVVANDDNVTESPDCTNMSDNNTIFQENDEEYIKEEKEELVTEMDFEEEKIQAVVESDPVPLSDSEVPLLFLGKIEQIMLTRKEVVHERNKIALSSEFLSKPHRCSLCLIGFEYKENWTDHMQRKHVNAMEDCVKCEICQQNVHTSSYPEHKSTHFIWYKCLNCEKLFSALSEAKRHYKKDHGNRKTKGSIQHRYKCKRCKMAFVRPSQLKMHMTTVHRITM